MNNIELAYFIEAVICAYLLMYVMIKYGEHQRANKKDPDPQWLQASRKTALFVAALLIQSSAVAYQAWVISIPVVAILFAVVMILALNAISQHRRTPSDDNRGDGVEDRTWRALPSGSFGYYLAQADVSRVESGVRHIIEMLEERRNDEKINPGPAVIDPNPVIIHPAQFRPRKAEDK